MPITACKDSSGKPIKKDGLQKYRVRVNYAALSPDGTTAYKSIERTAYGKSAASALEQELTAEAQKLSHAPAEVPKTFRALTEEYLSRMIRGKEIRETSAAKKSSIQNNHLLPFLGDTPLDRLTPTVLMSWQDYINDKGLGLTMRQHTYDELRAILNYAVRAGYLPSNPIKSIQNFTDANVITTPEDSLHFYTPMQYRLFEAALLLKDTPARHNVYVFFSVLFWLGVRKGEANALTWDDLEGTQLWIRRSVAQKVKGKRFVETPPKNKSSYRRLPIPAALQEILADQKLRQQADPRWASSWRICGGPDIISDTTITNANFEAAEAAGLPHIRVHDFRHSYASMLINANINIKAISARLGHARVSQTWDTYGHLYPESDDRIDSTLDSVAADNPRISPEKLPKNQNEKNNNNKKQ